MAQDLKVLIAGVREGRKTFANTMKYVFMATSANFGNMFSMAGASLFLPFLPLRSTQVLLTNLLTDFPEMQIAADRVDEEMLTRAQRWNLGFIKRFMLMFGSLSSVFDYLTFAVLLLIFRADETMFQTGWFTESVISAATIVFVVRSRKPLGQSRPGRGLSVATMLVVLATLALPYTPLAPILGFAPLPWQVLLAIFAVVALYVLSGEALKRAFYRKIG
jgi:Mg2+-importing ATPase